MTDRGDETIACMVFQTAINTNQCAALLDCLFEGGSATVDSRGNLVMIDADQLAQFGGNGER